MGTSFENMLVSRHMSHRGECAVDERMHVCAPVEDPLAELRRLGSLADRSHVVESAHGVRVHAETCLMASVVRSLLRLVRSFKVRKGNELVCAPVAQAFLQECLGVRHRCAVVVMHPHGCFGCRPGPRAAVRAARFVTDAGTAGCPLHSCHTGSLCSVVKICVDGGPTLAAGRLVVVCRGE